MTHDLGRRLRLLRRERRMTLQELARDLGVHFTTVSAWERGRSRPGLDALGRLATRLDVSLTEILGAPGGRRPTLRLAVWGRPRWLEFAARSEALLLTNALLAHDARGADEALVRSALEGGAPALADLLRVGTRYEVETAEAAPARAAPRDTRGTAWLEERLAGLPAPLRAAVEDLLADWLDLVAPSPEKPTGEGAGEAGAGRAGSSAPDGGAAGGAGESSASARRRRRRGLPLRE